MLKLVMWLVSQLAVSFAGLAAADAHGVLQARQASNLTAYVHLGATDGPPQHVASGFIYGIPDNFPNQIPNHWYVRSLIAGPYCP